MHTSLHRLLLCFALCTLRKLAGCCISTLLYGRHNGTLLDMAGVVQHILSAAATGAFARHAVHLQMSAHSLESIAVMYDMQITYRWCPYEQ